MGNEKTYDDTPENWAQVGNFGLVKIADWVSLQHASEILNLPVSSIRLWANTRKIKSLKRKKKTPTVYVSISDIEGYLAKMERIRKRKEESGEWITS